MNPEHALAIGSRRRRSGTILIGLGVALAVAACTGGASTPSPTTAASPGSTIASTASATSTDATVSPSDTSGSSGSSGSSAPSLAPSSGLVHLPGLSLKPIVSLAPLLNGHFETLSDMLYWNNLAVPLDGSHVFLAAGCKPGDICAPVKTTQVFDATTKKFTASTTLDSLEDPAVASLMLPGYGMVVTFDDVINAVLYNPSKLDTGLFGTYIPSGGTAHQRNLSYASFAALNNGKVLIAGGWLWPGTRKGAVLYDLNSDSFTPTIDLAYARMLAEAVVLKDGRTLVVGGTNQTNGNTTFVPQAELYAANGLSRVSTGSLVTPRSNHVAIRLQDGRVLIAGGVTGSSWTATAEIYDPATGQFTATGSMNSPRRDFAAALLNDGRVLVVGGNGTALPATTEIYNPATGKWVTGPSLSCYPYGITATTLGNGNVLVTSQDLHAALYVP